MPELPEVETIRKQLAKKLIGKKLNGKKIGEVARRAKILIIKFSDKTCLIFHLKLSGQLIFNGTPGKYTRQVFNFSDGTRLIFNDARKFAWYKIMSEQGFRRLEKKLGPEPFDITEKQFFSILAKRSQAKIKPLLMNQGFIAGIGNIYADEILFASGIHPTRQIKTLDNKEIRLLFKNIKKILKAAIKAGGSSVRDYIDAEAGQGGYQKYHKVYQRTGQKCVKCGGLVQRIKLGGRSAHFCPKCQRPKNNDL
ncbi:DNA-formamidopyrimidine glycosylase [bacterium (Candidatus Gribaldobacteria) CG08_land_8_20_14_0_20_39_15]|uniref:DNA-formamidopyrimidine glycosylase n=1 Tax=bacterium (Candidatus Gribaldobacteria) CG08_land_8_20_14_0_20_39_15 TaxID=2014273 RepID=A0A2M6XUN7_9BACT|nr:MAG: DNA-formamidopyrimidine glycosylase [bacterium (Candidatus Gribaldobacteria) CG08_land_8_20_14_0_20_39_15]